MIETESGPDISLAGAVMGSFPEYLEFSRDYSIASLAVPERLWRFMANSGDSWTMITSFWRQFARGKLSIALASNPGLFPASSLFAMELEFVRKLGYVASPSRRTLDFRGAVGRQIGASASPSPWKSVRSWMRRLRANSFRAGMQRKLVPGGPDAALEEKIQKGLSFLFRDFSATTESNARFPGAFGNAIVVVAAGAVMLRVVRDRDEFRIDIAPAHAPTEWSHLSVALAALETGAKHPVLVNPFSPEQAASLLEPKISLITEAFTPQSYPAAKRAMQELEAAKFREWAESFSGAPAADAGNTSAPAFE